MATSNAIITLRRHDLDNLRTFLTGLVSVHHTAIVYGGIGTTPFQSPYGAKDSVYGLPLLVFEAFNQSFFMGLFFWISGRVSAQSLARSGATNRRKFVKNKALRLAVPAVVGTLTIMPLTRLLVLPEWTVDAAKQCLLSYFRSLRGVRGAFWFTATLFVFDTVAACVVPERPSASTTSSSSSSSSTHPDSQQSGNPASSSVYRLMGRYGWIAVAAACWGVRLTHPVGRATNPISIQLAHAPQYVYAYIMGHLSYRYDQDILCGPLTNSPVRGGTVVFTPDKNTPSVKHLSRPDRHSSISIASATVLSLSLFTVCFLPAILSGKPDWLAQTQTQILGGCNLTAVLYAIWGELAFVIVGPALMQYFYTNHSTPTTSAVWQPRYSYAAFLVHNLVSTVIEVGVDSVLSNAAAAGAWAESLPWKVVGPLLLTSAVGYMNTLASFHVGRWAIHHIPGLKKII